MKQFIANNEKIPAILINRVGSFFFLVTAIAGFLYIAGTDQGFMDETQFLLLRFLTVSGAFLLISSVFGLAVHLVTFIRLKKARYIWGALLFVFFMLLGGIAVFASNFILIIAAGNTV